MHTDDDIFESLDIDSEAKSPAPADSTAGAFDDIFEDLSMEDKIFEKGLVREKEKKSAKAADGIRPNKKNHSTKSPKVLNTVDSSVDRKQYNKDRENKKKSRIKKIIICSVIEIFTLAAFFAYGYFLRSWNLIARPEVRLEAIENNNISLEKKKEMEGYWNIAVFGVDARSNNVVERGLNSDVIMIASINKDTGDIKLVSVFRDTYLNISEKNSYSKINQAYALGGPEQALAALNKNLDLNIQSYVAFNWKAVADGINILGGVDNIPISKAELYYINAYITETVKVTKIGSYQLTHTGEQHLDGVQAVAYGRLRYMDNDFARTERQRNVIKACFEKCKTAGFSVLNNIMVVCFPQVATNIDFNEIIEMARNITQYNIAETGGFPWSRADANVGSKGDCVVPTTLESNVIKLHEFLFGDTSYTPSDAVLSISERIKSESNMYKEGKFIESVATDGGVIQKPKTETEGSSDSSSDSSGSSGSSSSQKVTLGIDEDGNYIYPTDEDGNIIVPTDEDGEVVYPTDADGNIIRESSRPTELSTEDAIPGGNSMLSPGAEDDEYAGGPGSASNVNTNPTREATGDLTNNSPQAPASSGTSTTPGGTGGTGGSPGSSSSTTAPTATANTVDTNSSFTGPVISTEGPGSLSNGTSSGGSTDGPGSAGSPSTDPTPSGSSPGGDGPDGAVQEGP